MKFYVALNGEQPREVTIDGSAVRAGDVEAEAHVVDLPGSPVRVVTIGGRVYRVLVRRAPVPGRYLIQLGGFRFEAEVLDERARAIQQLAGSAARPAGPRSLAAPMPGLVVRVLVQPGDRVQVGQGLIVIEAMKMENELRATSPGVVRAVGVTAGSAVEKGALLVEFDPAD